MLLGMMPISGGNKTFPKTFVTIEAETLEEAAKVLGGSLAHSGKADSGVYEAVFYPDVPCGTFTVGKNTPAQFMKALDALGVAPVPHPVELCERVLSAAVVLLLGQVPSIT